MEGVAARRSRAAPAATSEAAPARSGRLSSWLAFWNKPQPIWVNERHRQLHYAKVAQDLIEVLPRPAARVLDFGCGAALHAERCAEACAVLYLCEAADTIRAELVARFGDHPRIRVIDTESIDELADGSLDLVFVNSVLQYLAPSDLPPLLRRWRAKLAPDGVLVLADVLPQPPSALADALSLVRVAWRHRFLLAALLALVRLAVGDYRRLRRRLGLSVYPPALLHKLLADAGFDAQRRPSNLGFNPNRMTIIARCSAAVRREGPIAVGEEGPDHDETGRHDLRGQIVQLQRAGERAHEQPGQQKTYEGHEHKAWDRGLVGSVAREGPAPIQGVAHEPAREKAEHRCHHRARTG